MRKQLRIIALAAITACAGVTSASALNFNAGDLVLFFQNPSGTGSANTIYVNLGSAITYRGAATGTDVANMLDIVNINSQLTTAFGAGWATETTLHAGLAAARSNNPTLGGGGVVNGDPNRTVYISDQRNSVGTVGSAGSVGYSGYGDGPLGTASSDIIQMNLPYDQLDTNGTDDPNQVEIVGVGSSNIDDQNPFLSVPNVQGNAFNAFPGGVQQSQSSSAKPALIGDFGPVSDVEFALDLYRIVSVTGKTGQLAGDVPGLGSYEGTVVLDNLGNVSFVTVPEPTTAALVGIGLGALIMRRRRQNA
jgi:hypothetical protein